MPGSPVESRGKRPKSISALLWVIFQMERQIWRFYAWRQPMAAHLYPVICELWDISRL